MNLLKFTPAALLILFISGCGILPKTHTDAPGPQRSNHTIQELCDFPKQFFADRFHAENLRVGVIATKPMTEKIDIGNGCDYHTVDGDYYLGYIFLDPPPAVTTSPPTGTAPPRTLTVDGISVIAIAQDRPALPPFANDPIPYVSLTATIDGWWGELKLSGHDDQTAQAGAQVLVNMIRAMKN
ncbi:hypothetical protein AB4305_28195 [Nocardia sp. 2YAB30]|uniref:hypothetical protein n=1 Tax=Nocardia sp. 2YAB30 TaxID=3233022 RepID=UPI003F984033